MVRKYKNLKTTFRKIKIKLKILINKKKNSNLKINNEYI